MLRNRTRTMTTKQALMPDQTHATSTLFGSPRFINDGFAEKPTDIETMTASPTSILDTTQFSPVSKTPPFGYDQKKTHNWDTKTPKRIGLALIGSLDEKIEHIFSQSTTRKVLFGSKLKIQISQIEPSPFSPSKSPESPRDFGTKTPKSPLFKSPSPFGKLNFDSPTVFDLSPTEMELSEEYTRVIAHGPSPRTIHIYDDCVLESCNGVVGLSELKKELSFSPSKKLNSALESFLSFCCTCKKSLDQGKDIYVYRGEKGFCSHDCRCKEMLSDGEDNF